MEFSEVIEVLDRGSSIDVQSDCTFESLMIGRTTLEKLKANRFDRPSPVQAKAIPVGLLGRDMLVQAKSGTGKTLVFSILAVENLDLRSPFVQKVIVTPTREIAVQIRETIRKVAPNGSRTAVYVGGMPHKLNILDLQQTRPQIIIGTPGRLCQLIKLKAFDLSRVDFFALDEADKLVDEAVFKDDINFLMNSLPPIRQVAVFSATYPRNLDQMLSTFLRDAALVRFNADDVQLVGIKQYVVTKCSPMMEKLTYVLKTIRFVQALVFCDQIAKCEPIANHLKSEGLDVTFVSSAMSQKDRQTAVDQLRSKRVKILVSSDLTARGIDADNVNLVVNIDAAVNEETYFHRIGRAARFGAHGAAVTLLEDDKALKCFTALAHRGKVNAKRVKDVDELPQDLPKNTGFWDSLPFFIDFNKSNRPATNDLSNVPDRQTAIENLEKERAESGISSDFKYDRNAIMSLKPTIMEVKQESPSSASGDDKENSEEVAQEKEVVVEKKSFKERLAELKAQVAAKKSEKEKKGKAEEVKVAEKTKFKFVPTRDKAKKKYYMRGELQHIRDSFSADQWRAYAASKFDLTQEPFIDVVVEKPKEEKEEKETKVKKEKKEKKKTIRYSRNQMNQILKAVPNSTWLPYVKSKWDTSEEPFVLDPTMRCSYEERLRRVRRKEKDERKKVMEERKQKKVAERIELVASGRTTRVPEMKEDSWDDYQKRVIAQFQEKVEKRREAEKEGKSADERRFGPVVPPRDSPLVYKYRVDLYKRRLAEQDAFVEQQLKMENAKVAETETQTEEVEQKVETADGECQTDVVEEEEYWDEDEEEWYDEEEEEEEEEEEVPESLPAFRHIQEEQIANLGASYIRNINFQAASQSYIDMMNSLFSR